MLLKKYRKDTTKIIMDEQKTNDTQRRLNKKSVVGTRIIVHSKWFYRTLVKKQAQGHVSHIDQTCRSME